jgi:hypothetical protein
VTEVDLDLRGAVLDVPGFYEHPRGLERPLDVGDHRLDLGALLHRVAVGARVERLPVGAGEVELELGRHDRLVAEAPYAFGGSPQDRAAVERNRLARLRVNRVAEAECGSLSPPGDAQAGEVRDDVHVRVSGLVVDERRREDHAVHVPGEGDVRDSEAVTARRREEVPRGESLPAWDSPGIREHAFDRVHALAFKQLADGVETDCGFGDVHCCCLAVPR